MRVNGHIRGRLARPIKSFNWCLLYERNVLLIKELRSKSAPNSEKVKWNFPAQGRGVDGGDFRGLDGYSA